MMRTHEIKEIKQSTDGKTKIYERTCLADGTTDYTVTFYKTVRRNEQLTWEARKTLTGAETLYNKHAN